MAPRRFDKLTQLGKESGRLPNRPGQATLERVRNPHPGILYLVRFTAPEFTSICPVTRQPDFAHLVARVKGNWYLFARLGAGAPGRGLGGWWSQVT